MTVTTKNLPALEVHWGGPDGTRDLVVAYLEFDGREWSFRYADRLEEATRLDFDGFKGFPKPGVGTAPAKSSTLFPPFASRIPNLKRADVIRACGDLTSLPREEAFYEFLRRSGGRTGTDQLWFTEVTRKAANESEGLGKALRNEIRKMVAEIRRVLEEDVRQQLEGGLGILPDGRILDIDQACGEDPGRRRDREAIESAIRYAIAGGRSPKEAIESFTREVGFTYLNRLAALRMMEMRGLIQESVSKGAESSGFRLFKRICDEVCRAHADGGYRRYLELLFDDVAAEVRVLFDRSLPQSRIFPRPGTLKQVLDLLNGSSPADVWKSDETIGWVYQYFTSKEDREALRDPKKGGSQAPRNSYELAVRNQFYTPRYVVEFLTDNTLGRIWYEMRQGNTRLKEACRYLVRRPNEVFLAPGETEPATPGPGDLSQEEILQQPVYVLHRARRDPRELRVLDPACGSGHFLLYALDLLLVIYEEAWADPESPPFAETGQTLREDYADTDTLRRELPGLILQHNLHGIDIDLRATQIAALALWLRAQRAYQDFGVKAPDRPRIRRSNIVCAEPMPGDRALLDEFLSGLQPPVLRQLVRAVFEKMELAGEAGSLLKIEEEIRNAVAEAKRQWAEGPRPEQILLWPEEKRPKPEQGVLFDTRGISEEAFWHDAEERVLDELKKYARHAENGRGVARQLFAEDAAQGFAFIDLCRKRFDVVLMNPPFGEFSRRYKEQARTVYPNTYNDIFGAFTERFLEVLYPRGFLGAITSRTGFFLTTFVRWRQEVLLKKAALRYFVDLGAEVMDEAMVEAAAYCLGRSKVGASAVFIRLLGLPDREGTLLAAVGGLQRGDVVPGVIFASEKQFELLLDVPFVYWVPSSTIAKLADHPPFEPSGGEVRQGLVTGDNPRFVRALWEVSCSTILGGPKLSDSSHQSSSNLRSKILSLLEHGCQWVPHVMAGASQPWYSPITVVVNWRSDGVELRNFKDAFGKLRSRPQNTDYYFRPGFSWTRRAVRFIPYAVPSGCISTASRYMAFPKAGLEYAALGITASNVATAFLRFYGEKFEWPNFLVENLKALPWPFLPPELVKQIEDLARREVDRRRRAYQNHEPFHEFTAPAMCLPGAAEGGLGFDLRSLLGSELDEAVARTYGLDAAEEAVLERDLHEAIQARRPQTKEATEEDGEEDDDRDFVLPVGLRTDREALLSYAVGCAFGRWDVRIARKPSLAPKLPGPFDPLPVCPPGMLVGTDGLPAKLDGIVSEEWLRARPNANTLPPEGAVKKTNIKDEEYPLAAIPWDGVLVDDEGHPSDIVTRVREILRVLWGDRADEIEGEACEILGVKDLQTYFRNPRNFFTDHIKRYSKSRRKAPIYWLLQSSRKSYGVWLYYHRLTNDTLFHVLRTYIEPKIQHEQGRRHELRRLYEAAKAGKNGREERQLAKEMDAQEALLEELADFKAKVEATAYGRLPGAEPGCPGWDPDLNDGVILNIAPLHAEVPWKEAETAWEELAEGRYEWSHVALRFWPKRVEAKCREDRSIALAHGRKVE